MAFTCGGISIVVGVVLAASIASAVQPEYKSTSIDPSGQLHIELASGKQIQAPKLRDQDGFDTPLISPDHHTVGWLATYQNPSNRRGARFAGKLVLYRGARILRTFDTEQTFWGWEFQDGGKHVAYSTGPTHGGAAECVLRDVDSGRVIARFDIHSGAEQPAWARTLHQ
jgi:hypothetical protein